MQEKSEKKKKEEGQAALQATVNDGQELKDVQKVIPKTLPKVVQGIVLVQQKL